MRRDQIIIKKQLLQIKVDESQDQQGAFDDWSDFYKQKIVPAIEEALRPFANFGGLLRIDHLKIVVNYNKREDIIENVKKQLMAEVRKLQAEGVIDVVSKTPLEQNIQVLKYYLTSGTLPYWYVSKNSDPVSLIYKKIKTDTPQDLKTLFQEIKNIPEAIKRLNKLQEKNEVNWSNDKETLSERQVVKYLKDDQIAVDVKKSLWKKWLKQLAKKPQSNRLKDLFRSDNVYDWVNLTNLREISDTLTTVEKKIIHAYLRDFNKLNETTYFLTSGKIEKAFWIGWIRYKLLSGISGFNPKKMLDSLFSEFAYYKRSSPRAVAESLSTMILDYQREINFESPLPDLILQFYRDSAEKEKEEEGRKERKEQGKFPEYKSSENQRSKRLPPAINYLFFANPGPKNTEDFNLENSLLDLLENDLPTFKKNLPLIINSVVALNRLLKKVSISLLDKILKIPLGGQEKWMKELLEDIESLFLDQVFPEKNFEVFQKNIRKQLFILKLNKPESYPNSFRTLLIRLSEYYGVSFNFLVDKIKKSKLSSRLNSVIQRIKKRRSPKEINEILSESTVKIQKDNLDIQEALSFLKYVFKTKKYPWWSTGIKEEEKAFEFLFKGRMESLIVEILNASEGKALLSFAFQRFDILNKMDEKELTKLKQNKKFNGWLLNFNDLKPVEKIDDEQLTIKNTIDDPAAPIQKLALFKKSNLPQLYTYLNTYMVNNFLHVDVANFSKKDIGSMITFLRKEDTQLFNAFVQRGFWNQKWKPVALRKLSLPTVLRIGAALMDEPYKYFKNLWQDLDLLIEKNKVHQSKSYREQFTKKVFVNYFQTNYRATFEESTFAVHFLQRFSEEFKTAKKDVNQKVYSTLTAESSSFKTKIHTTILNTLKNAPSKNKIRELMSIDEIIPSIESDSTGFFINNAGVIILASWLPQYFDRLDLLENKVFKNRQAQNRAVHLLQYLVSGNSNMPENFLVFNKVLCGLEVMDPVVEGIEMTDNEKQVSESMLLAIIQNWSALGNATIESLRGNFLARDGKLENLTSHWKLVVELKAYDVLVKTLPWSFGMVKLPWIERRIETIWI